jgi:hypothetical protein
MKYTTQLLLLILAFALTTSCSDDSTGPSETSLPYFTINDGNVWYYDIIDLDEGVEYTYKKIEEHTLSPSTVGGKDCLKYYSIDVGDLPNNSDFIYALTDESGYYIYYDELYEDLAENFTEFRNLWVKYIDFKNKEWTSVDINKDTTFEDGTNLKLSFKLTGSLVGREEVMYKNQKYNSFITRIDLRINETLSKDGESEIKTTFNSIEFTTINDIGNYKIRQARDGVFRDSYQVLTDHK